MNSYVLEGFNIVTEKDICDAISYQGGIAGTTVLLFDGSKLVGPVLKNNKEFKASRTGVRETHEVVYTHDTPQIYTISDITSPEIVTQRKISKYEKSTLNTVIAKMTKSTKECLFVPDMHAQQIVQQNRVHRSITSRAIAINDALLLSDVSFGTQTDNTETNITVQYIQERNDFEQGWACYPKNKKHTTQMS